MRIRVVTLATGIWGAENTLLALMASLRDLDASIALELVAPQGQLTEAWNDADLGETIYLPDSASSQGSKVELLKIQPRIRAFLKTLAPVDVIHSHHQWTHLPVALSQRKPVIVLDLHDFVRTIFGRIIQAFAVHASDVAFVASRTVRRQLPPFLRSNARILNRPISTPGGSILRAPAARGKGLRVVIVCRPDPNKEFGPALSSIMAAIRDEDSVTVAGGFASDFSVDSNADARLSFVGRLEPDALNELWDASDVHILTSSREPFGRVVIEAAGRGVPSIARRGAGVTHVMETSCAGFVLESWEQLDGALDSLRDDATYQLQVSNLPSLVGHCSPDVVATEYLKAILGTK